MVPERPILSLLLAAHILTACGRDVDLPPLPIVVVDQFHPVVQDQVQMALQNADAHRSDAGITGLLGMILQAYDQQLSASEAYAIARNLDPDEFRWAYYHGISLVAQGRVDEAQAAYRHARKNDDRFHGTGLRLALLLSDVGQYEAADALYRDLIARHADNAQVHFEYGQFLLRQSRSGDAIPELEKAIQLAGDFGLAHYSLMQAYRRTRDRDAARRHEALFDQFESVKLAISDPYWMEIQALVISDQAYLDRAKDLIARGRNEAAIVELRKAEDLNPDNILVHSNLIALLGAVGHVDEAGTHFEQAMRIDPLYASAYTSYATVLNYAKHHQEALRVLEEGIARMSDNLDLQLEKANTFLLSRDLDGARNAYQAALQIEPGHKRVRMQLGRLELQQGDTQSAIADFTQAVQPEDNHSAIALRALSGVSGLSGDLDASRRYLEQARAVAQRRGQGELMAKIEQDLAKLDATAAEVEDPP